MTQYSQPWGGTSVGHATRAPYTDEEWAEMYRFLLRANHADVGPLYGSGGIADSGLTVQQTTVASTTVDITAGTALVRGRWYRSDATVNLAVASNISGNPRIDTIILRADYLAQTITLVTLQGTAAPSPVAPTLTQSDGITWEVPLADIAVANGFATIVNANITPRRHYANAADGVYLYDMLNNSGALLEDGDVVVWDATADRAVKTSTSLGDPSVAGVWQGRTAAGGYGRVCVRGITTVKTSAAIVSRNLTLVQSGTAKLAVASTSGVPIGISLAITAGAGRCLAMVDIGGSTPLVAPQKVLRINGGDYTTNSLTFVDVDTANLILNIIPRNGLVYVQASGIWYIANNADATYMDWIVDSTTRAGDATQGSHKRIWTLLEDNNDVKHMFFCAALFTGLSAASHTFKLQWKSSPGVNVNIQCTTSPLFLYGE